SPQRALERAVNVLPPVATGVRVPLLGGEGELGGEHHPLTVPAVPDELPHQRLAGPAGVPVGGVDEVAAGVEVAVEHLAGGGLGGPPAPLGGERHGAQTEPGDAEATAAEKHEVLEARRGVGHGSSLLTPLRPGAASLRWLLRRFFVEQLELDTAVLRPAERSGVVGNRALETVAGADQTFPIHAVLAGD